MRRTSVSLPTNKIAHDPHEKPARYGSAHQRQPGLLVATFAYMSQAKQTRWIKISAGILVIIALFYYFSPSGVDLYHEAVSGSLKGGNNVPQVAPQAPPQAAPPAAPQPAPPAAPAVAPPAAPQEPPKEAAKEAAASQDGQTPIDSSYGTSKCSVSSSKDKPIVQYVMMIDAGSTGSRIHVYKFNNCGATPELEKEVFEMTKKIEGQSSGLSAYPDDPEGAAKSLDSLMEVAVKTVPEKLRSCSPIALKATAGLRFLGNEKSERILDVVRKHLETKYPFPVVSKEENGVAIMEGKDEGVYAWITINYLQGNIGSAEKQSTAAVFDLGGGSTQIVFEPSFKGLANGGAPEKLAEGDHKYDLKFGGREFTLYQHSHLGYGLMSARDAIFTALIDDLSASNEDTKWMSRPIINPCFSAGQAKTVKVKFPKGHALGESKEFEMTGPVIPSPAQCRGLAERILKKDAECKLAPCSFNGVHQPSIAKTFATEEIFFLSYFYDRTEPLGMPDSFTLREMHDLANTVCGGERQWDVFNSIPEAMKELTGRPEHCLDLNFMLALAHTGYEMPLEREVKIAKKIKGNELGWCLGASLPLLSKGSGWECKVSEVH